MADYKVSWTIEIEANSPEEAAKMAREIQADHDSVFVEHFQVWDIAKDKCFDIDLAEKEDKNG